MVPINSEFLKNILIIKYSDWNEKLKTLMVDFIPVNPPPLCRSLPRKSLISRMDWVSRAGDINLPHTPFPPAHSRPNKKFVYFLQSPYLFTIDRLFPSIVEIFRINFYRVSLDFSFRNTKLIVVYVIERTCTFSLSTIQN